MQKGQIARQWHAVARSWHTVARTGVIGTIKCKKVKLPGSGMHWHAVAHSGARWGDWDN